MRVSVFIFLFLISISFSYAQAKPNRNGNLIGYFQKSDLVNNKYKKWFVPNYEKYQPNQKVIKKIKKNLKGIAIISFVGTWCHDSKRVVPRFYKIMEAVDLDFKNQFKVIGISRGKKTPNNLEKGYNIKHTPTLIFYKNGKEIGRFVEHSRETLEKDILKILKGKNYKHPYQK